jgi:hypothetical protein
MGKEWQAEQLTRVREGILYVQLLQLSKSI